MLRPLMVCLAALSGFGMVQAQEVDVQTRAKAQADTSVNVAPDGSVSVQTRSKAEAQSSVTTGAPPAPQPRASAPRSEVNPQHRGGVAPAPIEQGVILVDGAMVDPAAPPRPRPPLPCKKTVEAVSDDLRITIVNNYCTVKITIQKLWREGGKTHVQFEADNAKGGVQANLRMVEKWTDRSGKAVSDPIDEQRVAIEKGRNTIFSVSGPTPNALTGTITLYR